MLKKSKTLCLLRNNTKPLDKWFLVVAGPVLRFTTTARHPNDCGNYSTGYGSPLWQVWQRTMLRYTGGTVVS